jgi:predicted phage-related endonuclease
MFANVDGILEDGAVLEAKNVGIFSAKKWGQPFTDDIPIEYYLQIAHYVRICDSQYARIAAYFGGSDFRVYEYRRNKDIENMIIKKCENFWQNHVLKRVPPPVTKYEDQVKFWKTAINDSAKEASEEIALKIKNYHDLQNTIKELEKKSNAIKSDICGFMTDAEKIILDGKTIASWKNQTTCRFDLKKFKESQSDLYKEYLNENISRVLRISNV